MKISKSLQKKILEDARALADSGKILTVRTLCSMHFDNPTSDTRKAVGELLDAHNIRRRLPSGPNATAKPEKPADKSDFGAKYEALSRVFVEVSKPSSDIDLYLVERAKAGNARALEILKKLVG